MIRRATLFLAFALAACATTTTAPPAMDADMGAPSRSETVQAVAASAAAVADAIGQAPPATLSRTTIDDAAIHGAFKAFDHALDLIDGLIASRVITPGSPTALTVRRFVLATQGALNTASAAQRAGTATSYTAALRDAQTALAQLRVTLAQ